MVKMVVHAKSHDAETTKVSKLASLKMNGSSTYHDKHTFTEERDLIYLDVDVV